MYLATMFKTFRKSESGAITVDWTVLTAAIVALGFAATISVATSAQRLGDAIGGALETENVELALNELEQEPAQTPPHTQIKTDAQF